MVRKTKHGFGAIAASLLLAACSGAESEPQTDDGAQTPDPTSATPAAEPQDSAAQDSAPSRPGPEDVSTLDGTSLAGFSGDPVAGEKAFLQCRTCHVLEPGVNRVGPSLAGIIGRPAGTVEGFAYSSANAESGIVWTPEKMFQFLENPRRVIPGTKMAYAGMRNPQDRANVIAYLEAAGE